MNSLIVDAKIQSKPSMWTEIIVEALNMDLKIYWGWGNGTLNGLNICIYHNSESSLLPPHEPYVSNNYTYSKEVTLNDSTPQDPRHILPGLGDCMCMECKLGP